LEEIAKLEQLRALGLPPELFAGVPRRVLHVYRQRAVVEEPCELRRHPASLRLTLLPLPPEIDSYFAAGDSVVQFGPRTIDLVKPGADLLLIFLWNCASHLSATNLSTEVALHS
jgi:hypothetical protein